MPEHSLAQSQNQSVRIFISWSGNRSKQIADCLKKWLEDFFSDCNATFFFSKQDLHGGDDWYKQVKNELSTGDLIVLCLTPENMHSPWMSFECGAIDCNGKRVFPFLFDMQREELISPLKHITPQKVGEEGTKDLVRVINSVLTTGKATDSQLESHFKQKWISLEKDLANVPKRTDGLEAQIVLELLMSQIPDTMASFGKRPAFTSNQYFAQVTIDALNWVKSSLASGPETHYIDLPITLYPSHLVNLLKTKKPLVKAVAVVDDVEQFWPQEEGVEIKKNTTKDSTRIFAFKSKESLRQHFSVLQSHAKHYNVYAVSLPVLTKTEQSHFARDFSLIGNLDPLLAFYHTSGQYTRDIIKVKVVRFSTHESEVREHLEAFGRIEKLAVKVESEIDTEELVQKVFLSQARRYDRKEVEMSTYIPISDYHSHEEKHAYFQEMMDRMILIIKENLENRSEAGKLRILEFGAGTGIFTKRLMQIDRAEIVAVEIDWVCYHTLQKTVGKANRVRLENRDSREYNPPGQFHAVATSFADHHIHPKDKKRYFDNVKNNLLEGSIFVVGDEFLREHDDGIEEERRKALHAWHGHIIEIAESNGEHELARLEREALRSGLEGKGDFKVSCSRYESELEESGLKVILKEKIGPLDREDIGGIFVYVIGKK